MKQIVQSPRTGELWTICFSNDATPFLRYRVGDRGTRSKQPCRCGRPGDVFLDIDGRVEDFVVTPEGRRVGRLDHIFKQQLDIGEAQILQDAAGALQVLVVKRDTYSDSSEQKLLEQFRLRLGDAIPIEIRYCETIDREPGSQLELFGLADAPYRRWTPERLPDPAEAPPACPPNTVSPPRRAREVPDRT